MCTSPHIEIVEQYRLINRRMEIPHEGAYCDLMWRDPDDIETWIISIRVCWMAFWLESC